MATPAQQVDAAFSQAQSYASAAQSQMTSFTNALSNSIYQAPSLSFAWDTIPAPTIPALPTAPTLNFDLPDVVVTPTAFVPREVEVDIPSFNEASPTVLLPTAPIISYGNAPVIPEVGAVSLPDSPTLALPDVPAYITLSAPTFAGVDLRLDYLERLEDIPTLDLVAPTPYAYNRGAEYASDLLATVQASLLERMAGGTGVPPAVEQALWDRARSRETQIALAGEAEIMRTSEAMGFHLPSGVLAAQMREGQKTYYDKLSGLSRDIAIKQAEMEQENIKQTISQGIELESRLIDYSYKLEQLTFEAAKEAASSATANYNAQVDAFRALLGAYEVYANNYKTIIEAELAKVDVYKAELQAEQTKADINKTLVEQYKATIDAGMTQVKIYEAQVGAANTLVQLEQTKISAAGEQIRAYVAQVNAETAKVEAYKAGVQAESTKLDIYRVKAGVFSTVAGVQIEKARLGISINEANSRVKAAEWEGFSAQWRAYAAKAQANAANNSALIDGYRASAVATEATASAYARLWEGGIKQYEAATQASIQAGKINTDAIIATNNARLDAAKVGAQVYAQLASSAYSMINASASVSASGGTSVSYSYSNDTVSTAPTVTAV